MSERGDEFPDAAFAASDVVEVLAVSQGWRDPELVEACSAAKDEFGAEVVVVGDLDDQPGEQQVLFDLIGCGPRGDA